MPQLLEIDEKFMQKLKSAQATALHELKQNNIRKWFNYINRSNPDIGLIGEYAAVRLDFVKKDDKAIEVAEKVGADVIKAEDSHYYGVLGKIG